MTDTADADAEAKALVDATKPPTTTTTVTQTPPTPPAVTTITTPATPTQAPVLPFYKQAPIWITLLLMPLVYIVVCIVLWPGSAYPSETRTQVITAIIGLLTLIGGYWLGSSLNSSKKDDALQAAASAPTTVVNNAASNIPPTTTPQ
jgi:hypothetical protein